MTYDEYQHREHKLTTISGKCVDMLMDAWFDLKKLPDWNGRMSTQSDRHVALATLIARQIRFLDAARGSAQNGSPQAVTVLNRCMYETYLNVLTISFFRTRDWNPVKLGTRFMAHSDFLIASHMKSRSKSISKLAEENQVDRKEVLKTYRDLTKRKRVPDGTFKSVSEAWHPFVWPGSRFSNLRGLAYNLWPPKRRPRFPTRLFPHGRREWFRELDTNWGIWSDIVHTTGYSSADYIRQVGDGLVHDNRVFCSEDLLNSIDFAAKSIQSVSIANQMEREWDMASYKCRKLYLKLASTQRPYFAINDSSRWQ
jgi:hypothetical protein